MKHSIPHHLTLDQARAAAHRAIDAYTTRFAKYHPEVVWSDEQHVSVAFHARGIKLSGAVAIERDKLVLDMDVPFLLKPFSKRAVEVIDREARRWIDEAGK